MPGPRPGILVFKAMFCLGFLSLCSLYGSNRLLLTDAFYLYIRTNVMTEPDGE